MCRTTIRTGLVLTLVSSFLSFDRAAGQQAINEARPPSMPGSFTGARPAGAPGRLGGSNIGEAPTGGIVGGPGMPGGFMGTEKSWHCPRCKTEVGRGIRPPISASCCGQNFVTGSTTPGELAAPPNLTPAETEPIASPTPPLPEEPVALPTAVTSFSRPTESVDPPTGNGTLIALGVGIVLVGMMTLGVVVFLAMQSKRGHARPRRPRRRREPDY